MTIKSTYVCTSSGVRPASLFCLEFTGCFCMFFLPRASLVYLFCGFFSFLCFWCILLSLVVSTSASRRHFQNTDNLLCSLTHCFSCLVFEQSCIDWLGLCHVSDIMLMKSCSLLKPFQSRLPVITQVMTAGISYSAKCVDLIEKNPPFGGPHAFFA